MTYLTISITSAAMILAMLMLRATALRRASRRWRTALWTVIAARMLLPVSLPLGDWLARCGLLMRPMIIHYVEPGTMALTGEGIHITEMVMPSFVDLAGVLKDGFLSALAAHRALFLALWLVPAAALLARFGFQYIACHRALGAATRIDDMVLLSPARGARVEVFRSSLIQTPMAMGVFRPRILLPAKMEPTDGALSHVLRHELTHIDRFDILRKNLLLAAACLHWFNPLAWLMLAIGKRDIELACDEQVLRSYGRDVRKSYALALISLEERRMGALPALAPFSANATEQRVIDVMNYHKPQRLKLKAAILLAALLLAGFTTTMEIQPVEYFVETAEERPSIDFSALRAQPEGGFVELANDVV